MNNTVNAQTRSCSCIVDAFPVDARAFDIYCGDFFLSLFIFSFNGYDFDLDGKKTELKITYEGRKITIIDYYYYFFSVCHGWIICNHAVV